MLGSRGRKSEIFREVKGWVKARFRAWVIEIKIAVVTRKLIKVVRGVIRMGG